MSVMIYVFKFLVCTFGLLDNCLFFSFCLLVQLIPVLKDFAEQFEKDGHKLVAEKIRNALEKV